MTLVSLSCADGVARIVLNRPVCGNAIDMALAQDLCAAACAVAADPAIRCVVLAGAGRQFCVGGDLAAFAKQGERIGVFLRDLATTLHDAVEALATMPKPLVCVIHGSAAGAGLSLAILGDIVLAGRGAIFTAAYAGVGLSPDGGLSWLLPRLVGLRRAQEMILTDRRLSADEAAAIGLITRAVDDDELVAKGDALAVALAAAPTVALAGARALLHSGATRDFHAHLRAEVDMIEHTGATSDARQKIAAAAVKATALGG